MKNMLRPLPFVLVSTNHGTMIVNRNDYCAVDDERPFGVGYQLMNQGSFDPQEIDLALALLQRRRLNFGDGVVAIDCGANIGVHTIEWARRMYEWGQVISFEAQEKIYYALAGNIAINNCFNVTAYNCAVGGTGSSTINIPEPNYFVPASYGSLELKQRSSTEYIGQQIDYGKTRSVALVSIDSLGLNRLDFLKIDVEGMEMDVLAGAENAVCRHKPTVMLEVIKSDRLAIEQFLSGHGYKIYPIGINILAIHGDDPAAAKVRVDNGTLWLG